MKTKLLYLLAHAAPITHIQNENDEVLATVINTS
jgi:hypothetical protein